MSDTDLMQLALELIPPWLVKACAFDAEQRRLDIEIDFARGGRFPWRDRAACRRPDTSLSEAGYAIQWRDLLHCMSLQPACTLRTGREAAISLVGVDGSRRESISERAWLRLLVGCTSQRWPTPGRGLRA
jgi:hypothetical protein